MRTIILAFFLGGIAFVLACAHEDNQVPPSTAYTTSGNVPGSAQWDAGPSEAPHQGWDTPDSKNLPSDPPQSILKDTGSR